MAKSEVVREFKGRGAMGAKTPFRLDNYGANRNTIIGKLEVNLVFD